MTATIVTVNVKPDKIEAFRKITSYNHENSRKEPGNVRFDVLQSRDDPSKFYLYEVYKDDEAAAEHKKTAHYLRWRDEVADYMAVPRSSVRTEPLEFD
ncbi:MAG: antibiotic biosynthesis monooxygenase [Eubacteriales bacterium]